MMCSKKRSFTTRRLFVTCIVATVLACCSTIACARITRTTLERYYPHWSLKTAKQYQQLVRLETFIERHQNQGYVAIFDWDGTLYSEAIPVKVKGKFIAASGQSAWQQWAAKHMQQKQYTYLFPLFHTLGQQPNQWLAQRDNYLEGRTNIKVGGYNKFSQIAILEAGMTPQEMTRGVQAYLRDYPTKDYAFLPMLDVLQRFKNTGFNVWIVTGSNAYYVATVLHNIEHNIPYTQKKPYHFHLAHLPYQPATDHIAGNQAKLTPDGRFSLVYDKRFLPNHAHKLYAINYYGKYLTIKNYIESKANKPAIFYAGNSNGDVWGMRYILQQQGNLVMAVNPRGKSLKQLIQRFPHKIILVSQRSRRGVDNKVKH